MFMFELTLINQFAQCNANYARSMKIIDPSFINIQIISNWIFAGFGDPLDYDVDEHGRLHPPPREYMRHHFWMYAPFAIKDARFRQGGQRKGPTVEPSTSRALPLP
jgi:hypothetical protein